MSNPYSQYITAASEKYGVPEKLIEAVIKVESGGDAKATSAAGAQGLMQLMPQTATSLGVKDAYDPQQNIDGGTKYLAQQLKAFGGNVSMALAAYNAGPGAVYKYNGVPPYRETLNYVKKVKALYEGSDTIDISGDQAANSNVNLTSGEDKGVGGTLTKYAQNITTVLFVLLAMVLAAIFFFQTFPKAKNIVPDATKLIDKAVG